MPDETLAAERRVFLSYAQRDSGAVDEMAYVLEQRGLSVWLDRSEIAWGESWVARIRNAVEAADTFVLVVSQASPDRVSEWEEAVAALDRRGIDVVPVVLPPPALRDLAGRPVLQYAGPSAGERLADRIELGTAIDSNRLSPMQFEAFAADLLTRYGYDTTYAARPDPGYDLRAVRDGEEILVQVKAYRPGSRVSVSVIQHLAALVLQRGVHGMLVTTGQLTSVAKQFLDRAGDAGAHIQVLDSSVLRQMLVANPDIARRYLTAADPETGPQ